MSETLAIKVMEALPRRDPAVMNYAQPDATASGGLLPGILPLGAATSVVWALAEAMSDFRIQIDKIMTVGDAVRIEFAWGGTHDQTLNLSMLGLAPVTPTGKYAWAQEVFIFRFRDNKVSQVRVESPMDGGIPSVLQQLGVMPA